MSDLVWYYVVGEEQRGPVSHDEISMLVSDGEIGPETLMWREGMANWATALLSLPEKMLPQSWLDGPAATSPYPPNLEIDRASAAGQSNQSAGYHHPTGLVDAVKTVFSRYFHFSGRARRAEFWYFTLFYYFVIVLFISFLFFLEFYSGNTDAYSDSISLTMSLYGLVMFFTFVGFVIPTLAVTSRRLHDIGLSGWWQVVPWAFGFMAEMSSVMSFLAGVSAIGLLVLLIWKGQPHDNRYGPA